MCVLKSARNGISKRERMCVCVCVGAHTPSPSQYQTPHLRLVVIQLHQLRTVLVAALADV